MICLAAFLFILCFPLAWSQNSDDTNTWTCGVFLAGEKYQFPLAKFYQIPSQKASCPAKFGDIWKRGRFSKKCGKLGKEWEQNWFNKANWEDLWSPFVRTLSGGKFDRDVCTVAREELGLENIPGLEYPEPLQLGFYYNYCGKEEWKDTGVRSEGTVCCKNGVSVPCDVILAELEAINDDDNDGGDKNGILSSGTKKSKNKSKGRTPGNQKNLKDRNKNNLSAQASDSNVDTISANVDIKSQVDSVTNLKAALEGNKQLSESEIMKAKKTIMGFRSAAVLLFKQAEDLHNLL